MFNVNEIRKDFPMLNGVTNAGKPLVYLDNGATTLKPNAVIEAVEGYYKQYTANAHRGDYEIAMLVDKAYENTRNIIAKFLNCEAKEVVYTSGTTASLNLVAYSYGLTHLKKDDVILLNYAEHASNVLPWFNVCKYTGAKIEYIKLDKDNRLTVENLKKALHKNVKIVSFGAVSNVLGYLAPVKEIVQEAHKMGAIVVVDGAQAVPHIKIDVKELDCDFLAFSAHKMCGPSGIGALYGKYDLLQEMQPFIQGGGANARFYANNEVILKDAPYKFEAGTQPIEGIIGMGAAIEYLQNIGMENIHEHELELRNYAEAEMEKLGNIILYNKDSDSGILSFNVKDIFAQDVASYLSTQGIATRSGNHCAKLLVNQIGTDASVRASIYFYNTKEDIDRLITALKTTTIENCINVIF